MRVLLPALLATAAFVLAVRGAVLIRERGPVARLEGLTPQAGASRSASRGPVSRLMDFLGPRLGPRLSRALGERRRDRISEQLDEAGHPDGLNVDRFLEKKAALAALGLTAAVLFLIAGSGLVAVPIAILAWFGLDIWLSRKARIRQEELERDLPDFLDILAVTVRAGLGYRDAMARVSRELGGPAAEEVTTALRQMQLGSTRREALQALRRRNDSEALDQFVSAQLQAEELGVPLAEALSNLASDMRRDSYQAARRRAARAAPRVSLIVTTLIVPGAIILILVALILGSDVQIDELGG